MKNAKRLTLSIFCILIFVVGLILFIIPFNFEKYKVLNVSYSANGSDNTQVLINLKNNSDKNQTNVNVKISLELRDSDEDDDELLLSKSINTSLSVGENEVIIIFEDIDYIDIEDYSQISLTIDGKSFNIYQMPVFSGMNIVFLSMIIFGFFAFVFVVASKNKFLLSKTETQSQEDIEAKISEAFKNIEVIKPADSDGKVSCPYCKCRYSSNLDRCPNCGAPPERRG